MTYFFFRVLLDLDYRTYSATVTSLLCIFVVIADNLDSYLFWINVSKWGCWPEAENIEKSGTFAAF